MKTTNLVSLISGSTLTVTGMILALGYYSFGLDPLKFWPLLIVLMGLGFTAAGFISTLHKKRETFALAELSFMKGKHKWEVWAARWTLQTLEKLGVVALSPSDSYYADGGFFIPGIPILGTGLLLLYTSVTGSSEIWATAWPLVILFIALGFATAAIFMCVPGLAIPASISGINGLILAFCTLTGLWNSWIILWPAEFLAIGLGLLILGIATRKSGVRLAATILFTISGISFFLMSFIAPFNNTILRYTTPAMLLITGLLLVGTFIIKYPENMLTMPS